ncbi:MAG: methyltransferase family protein [Candidatus Hodarchaeota archaeon]
MKIPGKTELLSHLPNYTEKKLSLLGLWFLGLLITTLFILYLFDLTPRYFPTINWFTIIEPYIPYLGSAIAIFGGLFIVHQTWYRKQKYLAQDKDRAYQKSIKFTFTGIPILIAGVLHMFLSVLQIPFNLISIPAPLNPLTSFLATSILQLFADNLGISFNDLLIRMISSLLLLILAIITVFRAIRVFGIDNAALVYLYYPEESKIVDHKIYSIVRHPLYVGVTTLALSAMVSQLSLYSIGIFIIFIIAFLHHIYIEEKELIERFGEGYLKYKQTAPALLIRPKNWGKYLKYLFERLK